MMVTLDQIQRGAVSYYESEIAQKANGFGQFAAYFFMPSIPAIIQDKINQFRDSPLADGLINADGLVDLDAVRDRAMGAMQHCGSLEIAGFRLNSDDVNKAYEAIRRA